MNIIVTTLLDLEHDRNGVVSVANDLNRLLAGAGHRLTVVTPPSGVPTVRRSYFLRMRRLINTLSRTVGSPALFLVGLRLTVWELGQRMAADADRCDVVIAHDPLSAGAALAAVRNRCPVLLFCHFWTEPWDEFASAGLLPAGSAPYGRLKRMMAQLLDHPQVTLLPVSESNRLLLRRITTPGREERIRLVYPGVTVPPSTAPAADAADHLPVIINVGNLEPRKNQRILPLVAAELLKLGCPCRFILTGPEETAEKEYLLAELRACGVESLFTLTGPQSRREVLEGMAKADLYVHTSLMESFGMTLVEAMAAGTPVMALEYEALHEILPETPEAIIPSGATPREIAEALLPLLTDRERRAALQARQGMLFARRFSSQAFLSRVLEVIDTSRRQRG